MTTPQALVVLGVVVLLFLGVVAISILLTPLLEDDE